MDLKVLSVCRTTPAKVLNSLMNYFITVARRDCPAPNHVPSRAKSRPVSCPVVKYFYCTSAKCMWGTRQAARRSAGVALEVNLRNPLCPGEKVSKWGIRSDFETQGRCHQKSKTGVSVAPQKKFSDFFFKKKIFLLQQEPGSLCFTKKKVSKLELKISILHPAARQVSPKERFKFEP